MRHQRQTTHIDSGLPKAQSGDSPNLTTTSYHLLLSMANNLSGGELASTGTSENRVSQLSIRTRVSMGEA